MNREDATSFLSEYRVLRTSISVLFFKPVGEPMDLSALQVPKPLGLESQVLHEQVALGDGYQVKPKWRHWGAKLTPK